MLYKYSNLFTKQTKRYYTTLFEKNVSSSGVGFLLNDKKGMEEFVVIDFTDNLKKEKYVTKFGHDDCSPSYICYNLRRIGYPCKDFTLISEKFPAQNLEAVSHLYTESTFLSLGDFQSNEGISNYVRQNCDSSDKQSYISSED